MTEREALKLALEFVEANHFGGPDAFELLTAIKQALAQPEQEPFGYFRYDLRLDAWVQNREGRPGTPFYTTPPHRKPLTDEEIKELYGDDDNFRMTKKYVIGFARAIEAAHGIKE